MTVDHSFSLANVSKRRLQPLCVCVCAAYSDADFAPITRAVIESSFARASFFVDVALRYLPYL